MLSSNHTIQESNLKVRAVTIQMKMVRVKDILMKQVRERVTQSRVSLCPKMMILDSVSSHRRSRQKITTGMRT